MQTGGAVQGANTIPWRGWLNVLLAGVAALAIAALVALRVWVGSPGVGGVETEDVVPTARAGTAAVREDAGNAHTKLAPGFAAVHDDAGNVHSMAGTASVQDDAGNVNPCAAVATTL